MIAKGHDIPNVTLVGVVSADVGLGMPDFRAAERTFQLLTQVAGRAGRGSLPGIVLMQTLNPDHYAVRLAGAQDYAAFYAKEIVFRRAMHYPPFAAMANVLVRAEKKEMAMRMSAELGTVLAPPPAPLGASNQGQAAPRMLRVLKVRPRRPCRVSRTSIDTSSWSRRPAAKRSTSCCNACAVSPPNENGPPPRW